MDDVLTKFERYILKRICRRLVVQGPLHKRRITAFYRVMRDAARAKFTKDNDPTLDHFLRECHDTAAEQARKADWAQWKAEQAAREAKLAQAEGAV